MREKFCRLSERVEDLPALQEKERIHRETIASILRDLHMDKSITRSEYLRLSDFIADLNLDEFFAAAGCFGVCFLRDWKEHMADHFVGTLTLALGGLDD